MKKVAYKKEPVLHVHNYICAIIKSTDKSHDVSYKYVTNLKEVNAVKKKLSKGQILEVYRASHNFIKAWKA